MTKLIKNDPRQYRTRSVIASGPMKAAPESRSVPSDADRLAEATFDKRWYVQFTPIKR